MSTRDRVAITFFCLAVLGYLALITEALQETRCLLHETRRLLMKRGNDEVKDFLNAAAAHLATEPATVAAPVSPSANHRSSQSATFEYGVLPELTPRASSAPKESTSE